MIIYPKSPKFKIVGDCQVYQTKIQPEDCIFLAILEDFEILIIVPKSIDISIHFVVTLLISYLFSLSTWHIPLPQGLFLQGLFGSSWEFDTWRKTNRIMPMIRNFMSHQYNNLLQCYDMFNIVINNLFSFFSLYEENFLVTQRPILICAHQLLFCPLYTVQSPI